ncbi:hypothetical protein HHL19_13945 [Streptomyces sp. R302]|uniref:hypothetical protein n=1 Tax=unclassified Streptomyces TaxID=2593676 RepID=UPI00145F5447|nr:MULTISPECIES: hypothetical protein [unclassified Streptomyces]NML51174.1 hypothetical protein [Streptomyces sp. R301]NML79752.1 hypothetical protein [Streptomyces sp. R302]
MADTADSPAAHAHHLLVALISEGPSGGAALGPDGAWLVATGHAALGMPELTQGRADHAVLHFEAAVTAGSNDCVMLHAGPLRRASVPRDLGVPS